MSEGLKKLKPPPLRPSTATVPDDENIGACAQLRVLSEYMMTEFPKMDQTEITELFYNFGVEGDLRRIREL